MTKDEYLYLSSPRYPELNGKRCLVIARSSGKLALLLELEDGTRLIVSQREVTKDEQSRRSG